MRSALFASRVTSVWSPVLPPWWGDERVHASHRATLLRKDPDWYGVRLSGDPELPMFWPVRKATA